MSSGKNWSAEELSASKRDLQAVSTWYRAGGVSHEGFVGQSLQTMMREVQQCIEQEEARLSQHSAANTTTSLRLKIKADGQTVVLASVSPSTSMRELKALIESSLDKPLEISRIRVASTGQAWGVFDEKSLASCSIQSNDVLTVDSATAAATSLSSSSSSRAFAPASSQAAAAASTASPLSRVTAAGLWPSNRFQTVLLALHCSMLEAGFVCVAEVPSSVPGFAPPVREVGPVKLMPDGWNKDPTGCALLYKHAKAAGKQFSFAVLLLDHATETFLVTLTQKGGHTFTLELNNSVQQFLASHTPPSPLYAADNRLASVTAALEAAGADSMLVLFTDFYGIDAALLQLVVQMLPPPQSPSSSGQGQRSTPTSPFIVPPVPGAGAGGGLGPRGAGRYDPRIGDQDLDPFGSGSGSFLGPDHAIFTNPRPLPDPAGGIGGGGYPTIPGSLGGRGFPRPRFDPFGPPVNPNILSGGVPGRVRVPGEPDPDHFIPPDMDVDAPNSDPLSVPGRGGRGGRGPNFPFGGAPDDFHRGPFI
jgi:hypothetical protein